MDLEGWKPRLKWRRTWPDGSENDFVGTVPGQVQPDGQAASTIGRILIIKGGPQDQNWAWAYQANFRGLPWKDLSREGYEPMARAAAKRIEDTWFQVIVGTAYERPYWP